MIAKNAVSGIPYLSKLIDSSHGIDEAGLRGLDRESIDNSGGWINTHPTEPLDAPLGQSSQNRLADKVLEFLTTLIIVLK